MTIKNEQSLKHEFQTAFNDHLDKLTTYYENQIKLLTAEQKNLLEEVLLYKQKLAEKEEMIQELLAQHSETESIDEADALEEFFNPEQYIPKQIELLERALKEKDYRQAADCLQKLLLEINDLDSKEIQRILDVLLVVFQNELEDFSIIDDVYNGAISLIKNLTHRNEAKMFLFNNHELISSRVLELNDPFMICELARTYFAFNFSETQMKYFRKMIEQWPFIDAEINKETFTRLIWLSFHISLDNKLVDIADESSAFLSDSLPELKIYSVYRDMMIGKLAVTNAGTEISKLKKKVTLFTEDEQEKLFKSLDKRIRKKANRQSSKMISAPSALTANQTKPTMQVTGVRKMDHITKLPKDTLTLPGTNIHLQEEWINLAMYKDIFSKENPSYVLVRVLSNNKTGKAFVTPKLLMEIGKKVGKKHAVDVKAYDEKPETNSAFTWPGTEVKGTAPDDLQDKVVLNEESALKKLGYQITGLSREKRWSILVKAVRQIGLKKVATIIAQNVKLRKGQKNGEKKFKYAISEWEHDLAKL